MKSTATKRNPCLIKLLNRSGDGGAFFRRSSTSSPSGAWCQASPWPFGPSPSRHGTRHRQETSTAPRRSSQASTRATAAPRSPRRSPSAASTTRCRRLGLAAAVLPGRRADGRVQPRGAGRRRRVVLLRGRAGDAASGSAGGGCAGEPPGEVLGVEGLAYRALPVLLAEACPYARDKRGDGGEI